MLDASERKYRDLFERANVGIILHTLDGRLLDANPKAQAIFRCSREALLKRRVPDLHPPASLPASKAAFDQIARDKVITFEIEFQRCTGEIFSAEVSSSLFEVDGRPLVQAILTDIAERKKQEEALAAYSEQLEELVAARTQELVAAQDHLVRQEKLSVLGKLAGGLAHELRNPLSVIEGAAYFLTMTLADMDDETAEAIEILNKEVQNAETIISGLLNFARTQKPRLESVSINDILVDLLGRLTIPETIAVVTELADDLPHIPADPQQIMLVCRNIIRNAVQAMAGGGQLTIVTRAEPVGVVIAFTDSGPGFPPAEAEKLFEPLYSTKAKGVGLGLALVNALVAGHGGRVTAVSAPGAGATFTVHLPD
ncbi:MAG: nitrogen regulation protein NR(II) [Anaerolineae bacterium]